jgi:hypothetical protein
MIPVMTSTKIDKSTIDLAGVEAGAKMFVPGEYEPESLAHPVTAGKKRRSIVRARNGNVEDLICGIDISLLPFSIFQMLVLPAGFALSSHYLCKALAMILTARNSIEWRARMLPKKEAACHLPYPVAMKTNRYEIPNIN